MEKINRGFWISSLQHTFASCSFWLVMAWLECSAEINNRVSTLICSIYPSPSILISFHVSFDSSHIKNMEKVTFLRRRLFRRWKRWLLLSRKSGVAWWLRFWFWVNSQDKNYFNHNFFFKVHLSWCGNFRKFYFLRPRESVWYAHLPCIKSTSSWSLLNL